MKSTSVSNPELKFVRHNIGNGYGHYCMLDDPYYESPYVKGQKPIRIVTKSISDSALNGITIKDKNMRDECAKYDRHTISCVRIVQTTIVALGFACSAIVMVYEICMWYRVDPKSSL